jgi:hypothetical protein
MFWQSFNVKATLFSFTGNPQPVKVMQASWWSTVTERLRFITVETFHSKATLHQLHIAIHRVMAPALATWFVAM